MQERVPLICLKINMLLITALIYRIEQNLNDKIKNFLLI